MRAKTEADKKIKITATIEPDVHAALERLQGLTLAGFSALVNYHLRKSLEKEPDSGLKRGKSK